MTPNFVKFDFQLKSRLKNLYLTKILCNHVKYACASDNASLIRGTQYNPNKEINQNLC